MTEDEAKSKWCPFARVVASTAKDDFIPGVPAFNRIARTGGVEASGQCIGSACMAWRWKQEPLPAVVDDAVDGDGFCGLAGSPS